MPTGSHRKRHPSRRAHTSRAAIRDADSDQARPSPLDRIHTAEGVTLQHREMGPIQLTNNFITESGELRLLIMVPEDSSGSIGVKVSNITHRVERMPADGTAAAGGLLRIGDRVISVDGTLLGETKLVEAINVSVREHALIVQRAATDLRAVNGLKQLPEAALAGCHLAQLLRANLGSTRLAGKRTQLGLNVNKNNGIDYVVPGSVAAFEGTLRTCDVVLELNGRPLNAAWLVDAITGSADCAASTTASSVCALTVVRLPAATRAAIAAARAAQLVISAAKAAAAGEKAAAKAARAMGDALYASSLGPSLTSQAAAMPGGDTQHGYEQYKDVLAAVGGYVPAARLVMQSDREALHLLERSALVLQRRYRHLRLQRKWIRTIAALRAIQVLIKRHKRLQAARLARLRYSCALSIQARYRNKKARQCMRMAMRHRQAGELEAAINVIELLRRVFDPKGGRTARRNQTQAFDEEVADVPTAVELVLVGGDTLLAELSSTAAKLALTKATAVLLGVEARRVRLELSAGSVVVKVAVAGADDPSSRSAKEGVARLLEMEGKDIASQLGTALGGLISCELELKGAPCEIAPMEEVMGDTQAAMMRMMVRDGRVIEGRRRDGTLVKMVNPDEVRLEEDEEATKRVRRIAYVTPIDIAADLLRLETKLINLFYDHAGIDSTIDQKELFELVLGQVQDMCVRAQEALPDTLIASARTFTVTLLSQVKLNGIEDAEARGVDWPTFVQALRDLAARKPSGGKLVRHEGARVHAAWEPPRNASHGAARQVRMCLRAPHVHVLHCVCTACTLHVHVRMHVHCMCCAAGAPR